MVGMDDYKGHQTIRAVRECRLWLTHWDQGKDVPSVRIASGGPTQEQVAQVLLAAMVRRMNGKIPRTPHAFIAQADCLMLGLRRQGFDLKDGALGGVINFAYWMLRDGPEDAMKQLPRISWQAVSRRWPHEPKG
jgi:hypothetical protein